jgi:hypothetical protein
MMTCKFAALRRCCKLAHWTKQLHPQVAWKEPNAPPVQGAVQRVPCLTWLGLHTMKQQQSMCRQPQMQAANSSMIREA